MKRGFPLGAQIKLSTHFKYAFLNRSHKTKISRSDLPRAQQKMSKKSFPLLISRLLVRIFTTNCFLRRHPRKSILFVLELHVRKLLLVSHCKKEMELRQIPRTPAARLRK